MDRLISMAWRALYVTVGACAVLVAQSVTAPEGLEAAPAPVPAAPAAAPELRVSQAASAVGMPTPAAVTTTARVGRWVSDLVTPTAPRSAAQLSCAAGSARSC